MQALRAARRALESTLDRYANACLTIADGSGSQFNTTGGQNVSQFMTSELEKYTDFEKKTARVKRLLGRANNSLTSLVPIHSLSDDILLHIFRLVMDEDLTTFEDVMDSDTPQVHILATSQVCTRWRQVALGSKSLWSDIRLSMNEETFPLGQIFADRSGDLPVNVGVIEPYGGWDDFSRRSITRFFSGIGSRVVSFELAVLPQIGVQPHWSKAYFYILGSLFRRLVPGQFTRLTLSRE